jgi:hypothetical protein
MPRAVSNPWRGLAAAIIHSAVNQHKKGGKPRQASMVFFNSEWFEELADFVEIHPDRIRKHLGIILPPIRKGE